MSVRLVLDEVGDRSWVGGLGWVLGFGVLARLLSNPGDGSGFLMADAD